MQKLFSYGTLQQPAVQLETFGRLLNGTRDALPGYIVGQVRITDPQVIATSGTDIHPILQFTGHAQDLVEGTVFEISETELAGADEYEVEDYVRVAAQLKSGATAWIYAARGGKK